MHGQVLVKERVVPAAPAAVWEAWTTSRGARTFFAPVTSVRLEPGGPFEMTFDPYDDRMGSKGCRVLAWVPGEMLAFEWNAPPHLRGRVDHLTFVVVQLAPEGEGATRVRLVHGGRGEGAAWEEERAYFEKAWDVILDRLERRFREGPVDWSERY